MSDLEETLDRLESRCTRFNKGSKKYKEGVNSLAQAQQSFAEFLEEFCGSGDEESMMLGMLLPFNSDFSMHTPYHVPCSRSAYVQHLIMLLSSSVRLYTLLLN